MTMRSSMRPGNGITRRTFVRGTAAAAAAVLAQGSARSAPEDGPIRLGVIGCGGRGTWLGKLFREHGGYRIAAAADYFQDRVKAFGDALGVPETHRFTGLGGYRRLLEQELDAVAIVSPPYFHPEQAAAAVASDRHVYLAKPVAVDVPGCRSIEQSGAAATRKGLAFLVDFQTRADPTYTEAVKRVHGGAIGDLTFGEARYHTGTLGAKGPDGPGEARLRNWVFDKALSGDIITEQNIHSLDVMSWILGVPPGSALGTGGRKARTHVGDCWDHFALLFNYPGDVGVTFSSKQYRDGGKDAGITVDVFGTNGRVVTAYGGAVMILGKESYKGGRTGSIYREGAVRNIARFHKQVTTGEIVNDTVDPSVRSNLVTILGRTAAYEKRLVTWEEISASTVRLDGGLNGLRV